MSAPEPGAFFCPMCDGVVADAPGTCPMCGMALESRTGDPSAQEAELADMRRRFVVSACFALPLVADMMGASVIQDTVRGRNPGACVELSSSRVALWVASVASDPLETSGRCARDHRPRPIEPNR